MAFFDLGQVNTRIFLDELTAQRFVTEDGRLDYVFPLSEDEMIVCRLQTRRGDWLFAMNPFDESRVLWQAFRTRDGWFEGEWYIGNVRELATDDSVTTIADIMVW